MCRLSQHIKTLGLGHDSGSYLTQRMDSLPEKDCCYWLLRSTVVIDCCYWSVDRVAIGKCVMWSSHHAFTNGYSIYWPIKSLTKVFELSTLTNTTTWLWRWLPHRLSKRQSITTVLLRTPVTQMIFFNQGLFIMLSRVCDSIIWWCALG